MLKFKKNTNWFEGIYLL